MKTVDEKLTILATVIRKLEDKLAAALRDVDDLRSRLDQLEPRMDGLEAEVL